MIIDLSLQQSHANLSSRMQTNAHPHSTVDRRSHSPSPRCAPFLDHHRSHLLRQASSPNQRYPRPRCTQSKNGNQDQSHSHSGGHQSLSNKDHRSQSHSYRRRSLSHSDNRYSKSHTQNYRSRSRSPTRHTHHEVRSRSSPTHEVHSHSSPTHGHSRPFTMSHANKQMKQSRTGVNASTSRPQRSSLHLGDLDDSDLSSPNT